MRVLQFFVLAVPLIITRVAHAETTCTITEKFKCAQGQGCALVDNTIVVRINAEQKIYSRCDAKGCDDYPAQFAVSGAFMNIALPSNGMLAKLSMDGSNFTEVVTLGTVVLVSYGACQ